ncbi:MAG: hypothetical protein ABIH42_01550 [Planctomycetota bacterium]
MSKLTAGSPSGLDMNKSCITGGVMFDCGMGTTITIPPTSADISVIEIP